VIAKARKREKRERTRARGRAASSSSLISRFRPFAFSRFSGRLRQSLGSAAFLLWLGCEEEAIAKARKREKREGACVAGRAASSSSLISRFRPFAFSRFSGRLRQSLASVARFFCGWCEEEVIAKARKREKREGARVGGRAASSSSLVSRFRPFALSRLSGQLRQRLGSAAFLLWLGCEEEVIAKARKREKREGARVVGRAASSSSLISRFRPFALSRLSGQLRQSLASAAFLLWLGFRGSDREKKGRSARCG
jgi:hypothetical protein